MSADRHRGDTDSPARFASAEVCAKQLAERLHGRIAIGIPVGLGKPVHLTNALYGMARKYPDLELSIHTGLTLEIPRVNSPLQARLLDPILERLYGGVPELSYARDLRSGNLPANVRVEEFYLRPGVNLDVPGVQQNYLSVNYASVAQASLDRGVNVIGQMIAPGADPNAVSLSCNPDVTLDLLDEAQARGNDLLTVGEVNPQLPFMPNDAVLPTNRFDMLLETGDGYPLFPVPNRPVGLADFAIALRVAGLVKDGGTLQIGIGGLGDSLAYVIGLRHTDNGRYRDLLAALEPHAVAAELDPLPQGLYGASEMFVEGFLHLRDAGVLRRTVADGLFLHAGFYLGSARFYERLRRMSDEERRGINMTRISFTNSLLHDGLLKTQQRRDARFVNSAMMVTLGGAVVSDGLEDGRVVSGVGGQYDFVAMAHALPGARSVIALPATRSRKGKTVSNIVWRYAHTTIPRHLRDIVVTEYGVADLRNATDAEIIKLLLNITDSRFQESLRGQAVSAGKLSADYQIPESCRGNLPRTLTRAFEHAGHLDLVAWYPLGTDLAPEEAELALALTALDERQGNWVGLGKLARRGHRVRTSPTFSTELERMGLSKPGGLRERLYQALIAGALDEVRSSGRPVLPAL